jgi:hypothetical protein
MHPRALPATLLLVPFLLVACASAQARQVRQTSDGGTILVSGGSGTAAAFRQAVSSIEQQCRGVYEVVELAQVQTGQSTSTGIGTSFGPIAVGTSSSSPVFGTSITYVCRPPQSTVLNETLIAQASADLVGKRCNRDDDCGPLFCARAAPADASGRCAAR